MVSSLLVDALARPHDLLLELSRAPDDGHEFPARASSYFRNIFASQDAFDEARIAILPQSLKPRSLVRFDCMIQDTSSSPEVYLSRRSNGDCGGWGLAEPDGAINGDGSVDYDLLKECSVVWAVSIPGKSSWCSSGSHSPDTSASPSFPHKYPLHSTPHLGVQVKIYDPAQSEPLRATDLYSFIGILGTEPWNTTLEPASSAPVPTIHVLFSRRIAPTIVPRLFPDPALRDSTTREQLISWIADEGLSGDRLAAEWVLLSITSKVQSRIPPILPLSLALTGYGPALSQTPKLVLVLSELVPMLTVLPLSLGVLNSTPFIPESKDEDLHSGWLQLPKGSLCVVSEIALEEGQILEKGASVARICIDQPLRLPQGVLNLRTVQDAIAYQTVDYVFPFSRFSFETDISFLVLSGGSSSPFFKVPVRAQTEDHREGLYAQDGHRIRLPSPELLSEFRKLIGGAKIASVTLDGTTANFIQDDFVKERQAASSSKNAGKTAVVTSDDLITRMMVANVRLGCPAMATTAGLPPYMLPGVPVHQPAHLEGDPTLATEILPGPPSLVSAQQSAQKRDPRKPSTAYSYLPLSDPGSTYSGIMHGTLIGHEEPRSKRPRNDKGSATGRAQRASARNQTAMTLAVDHTSSMETPSGSGAHPIILDAEPSGSATGDEEPTLSRSNSSLNLQDPTSQNSVPKGGKKDKGKGREVATPPTAMRVKEEPKAVPLATPEPAPNLLNNNDHCSSCRSNGSLVYCDGCPRAFHLWCLDPPMENIDEGDSRWFCPGCVIRKNPPRKPPPSVFSPLIHLVQNSIPVEYQLPDDVRNFFRDVTTGQKGTYVDATEVKPPRLNRLGQLEDRDPHRLRDKNGIAVLCFRCGMSALPAGLASTMPTTKRPRRAASKASTPDGWKSILSCDYCDLHWHLDCLSPPLSAMPLFSKKWMCPNHAERVLPPKRRIPKNHTTPIDISKPRQYNNGNIEIVQSEPLAAQTKPKVQVDEVLINGRRYRVPERIVILDFWNRLSRHDADENREIDTLSALSSPLTSLSSLDDPDESMDPSTPSDNRDDMQAAQLLFNFSSSAKHQRSKTTPTVTDHDQTNGVAAASTSAASTKNRSPPLAKAPSDSTIASTSTQPTTPVIAISARPSRSAKKVASLKISSAITDLNGLADSLNASRDQSVVEEVPKKRQRAVKKQTEKKTQSSSTRELRSRSRNTTQDSISSVATENKSAPVLRLIDDSLPAESPVSVSTNGNGKTKFRPVFVKREEDESSLSLALSGPDQASTSTTASQPATRRRQSRRSTVKATEEATRVDEKEPKEKRGRKRKLRDDDLPEPPKKPTATSSEKRSRRDADSTVGNGRKKSLATPSKSTASASVTASGSTPDSVAVTPTRPPTTPLVIRLPRIGSTTKPAVSTIGNGNADTPSRL
ncbi:hypothetical protein MD484_g4390, partial [Candolleomyces efflorescens]